MKLHPSAVLGSRPVERQPTSGGTDCTPAGGGEGFIAVGINTCQGCGNPLAASVRVAAGKRAAALQGLRQLMVLELGHAACFDRQCLLAVAGMSQLQELWLDGASEAWRRVWATAWACCSAAAGCGSRGHAAALRPHCQGRPDRAGEPGGHAAGGAEWFAQHGSISSQCQRCGRWGPGSAASCCARVCGPRCGQFYVIQVE
jgi:hypothetical protein